MSAMTTLPWRPEGWTVDDLDLLPEDELRYELFDGALLVTPPPEIRHDDVAAQLIVLLGTALPGDLRVAGAAGVYFDLHNYRQPDVAVYRRSALSGRRLGVEDVLLAVEIMSPTSVSTDRVAKPAQYAAAGIVGFWRLELDPLVLIVHELDGDVYREVARFADEVVVDEPVPLRFRLADLMA
jgi:Uma2 family endonuclease